MNKKKSFDVRSTTVLLVRREGRVAMAGDGQVTVGETVMKAHAKKVRRLYNDKILAGFAGATGDAFSLLTRFEGKLEQYHGNLERAAIELSKEWRTDKILRHLEALLVVADEKSSFLLSGNGDVISPDDGLLAIGSGGSYALAAARALVANTELSAREIAKERRAITLVSHPGTISATERAAIEALFQAFDPMRYDRDTGPVRFVTLAQLAKAYGR